MTDELNSRHFVSYDNLYITTTIADTLEPNGVGSSNQSYGTSITISSDPTNYSSQGGEVLSPCSLEFVPGSSDKSEETFF